MSGINILCINKITLSGQVATDPVFAKPGAGPETCSFALETKKVVMSGGDRKVIKAKHQVRITNKLAVNAFKGNLKKGFHLFILGELDYDGDKAFVRVTDYGHEASYQYVGDVDHAEDKPAQETSQASRQQTPKEEPKRNPMAGMGKAAKKPEADVDDGYFSSDNVYKDRGPSTQPEGFDADDIPF